MAPSITRRNAQSLSTDGIIGLSELGVAAQRLAGLVEGKNAKESDNDLEPDIAKK